MLWFDVVLNMHLSSQAYLQNQFQRGENIFHVSVFHIFNNSNRKFANSYNLNHILELFTILGKYPSPNVKRYLIYSIKNCIRVAPRVAKRLT